MGNERFVIALGMFDGVHLGHQALLNRTVEMARKEGCVPAVYTFSNHPLELFSKEIVCLTDVETRVNLFKSLGIERVDLQEFTHTLAALEPDAFLAMLNGRYRIERLVAGFNYSFGRGGSGSAELLLKVSQDYGFKVDIVAPVIREGGIVSSSRIRGLIGEGEVETAAKLLGRPYLMAGTVVHNRRIGSRLGFPTANIEAGKLAVPADGVYAVRAFVNGRAYEAVTNVGTNPTFEGGRRTIETHLIGFDEDLYGKALKISFISSLRGEKTFSSADSLRLQIKSDIERAREILQSNPDVFEP
ncbi:MAG: bifunctional riboflavin kinase/FAD synthetase [Clostridia bacterium]|nr:bifunctional riboflavin kinase/FAD synthetase [Clostridia bacterium]